MSTESSRSRWQSTLAGSQRSLVGMTDLVGRKWHPVILNELLVDGPMGFSDLKDAVDGISSKMLSDSLETMGEEYDLVEREIVNEQPIRVEYSLTDRGKSMEPVIAAMHRWADEYLSADSVDPGGDGDHGRDPAFFEDVS